MKYVHQHSFVALVAVVGLTVYNVHLANQAKGAVANHSPGSP